MPDCHANVLILAFAFARLNCKRCELIEGPIAIAIATNPDSCSYDAAIASQSNGHPLLSWVMTYNVDSIADLSRDLAFQVEQMLRPARSFAGSDRELHFAEAVLHMSDPIWTVPCRLRLLLLLLYRLAARLSRAQAPK